VAQLGGPLHRYVVEGRGGDNGEADEEDVGHGVAAAGCYKYAMREGIGVPERAQAVVLLLPRSVPERSAYRKTTREGRGAPQLKVDGLAACRRADAVRVHHGVDVIGERAVRESGDEAPAQDVTLMQRRTVR
jgi:hypothetical protein